MEIFIKVLIFVCTLVGLFMYVVMVGGSMSISDEERRREDEEQIKYLNEHKDRRHCK